MIQDRMAFGCDPMAGTGFPRPANALARRSSSVGVMSIHPELIPLQTNHEQRGGPNMAKKAVSPATVTLKHLAAAVAEEQELSKKQAEGILTDVVTRIAKHLKKGDRIR